MPTINPTTGKKEYSSGEVLPTYGTPEYTADSKINSSPAPTVPAPVNATLVDRYAKQKESIDSNPNLNISAPDENTIRESYRQRNMQYVDAIRTTFDQYLQQDTQAKQNLEAKAYLGSLAGGRSGSISGASEVYKAAETGEKKVRDTTAQRDLAIAKILQDGDMRASEEFKAKRNEYLSSAKDKAAAETALNGTIKSTALSEIGTLATAGKSYSDLVKTNPRLIEQYKTETGLDDTGLQALFISKVPKPTQVKLGDGSIAYYQQETDDAGNVTMKEVGKITGSAGKTIKDSKITDNGVQILYTDGTYEFKGNPGDTTPSNSKPVTGAPKSFTVDDVDKGKQVLAQSGKGDGYASPGIYVGVYQKWIQDGGTLKKFIELYPPDEFVNPAEADNLPTFLQPSASTIKKSAAVTPPSSSTPSSSGRTY